MLSCNLSTLSKVASQWPQKGLRSSNLTYCHRRLNGLGGLKVPEVRVLQLKTATSTAKPRIRVLQIHLTQRTFWHSKLDNCSKMKKIQCSKTPVIVEIQHNTIKTFKVSLRFIVISNFFSFLFDIFSSYR